MDSNEENSSSSPSSSSCRKTQDELHTHFRACNYGQDTQAFNAHFAPHSQPPKCILCGQLINEHINTSENNESNSRTNAPSSSSPDNYYHNYSYNNRQGGYQQQPQYPLPNNNEPVMVAEAIQPQPHHRPAAFIGSIEGAASMIKTTMIDPIFGSEIRPYKYSKGMNLKKMPRHWDLMGNQNGGGGTSGRLTTAFGDAPEAEKRPWNAPFLFPCADDCGAVCDCMLCSPCFLARVSGGGFDCCHQCCNDDLDMGHPGYFPVAKIPGKPIEDPPLLNGVCACALHVFFLPFWIIPVFWPFLCGDPRCSSCPTASIRIGLIKNEDIDEHCCSTKMKTMFCCPCTLLQTHRELRSLGYDPGTTCCSTRPEHVGSAHREGASVGPKFLGLWSQAMN